MTTRDVAADLRAINAELRQINDHLRLDLQLANEEITKLRRQKTAAENRTRAEERASPDYQLIERLYEYWKTECNHPNAELGPKREQAVRARLEGRAKRAGSSKKQAAREIAQAIKGAAVAAYVDDKGVRHDDLELICRNEVKLESFITRYEKWKEQQHGR